jgi:salicylate hydroxylase
MVLSTLLGEVTSSQQLEAALKAYDEVRRPRTQHIVKSSHGVGMVLCGKGEEGLDVKRIAEELPPRWVVIHGLDQKAHKREALEAMRKMGSA